MQAKPFWADNNFLRNKNNNNNNHHPTDYFTANNFIASYPLKSQLINSYQQQPIINYNYQKHQPFNTSTQPPEPEAKRIKASMDKLNQFRLKTKTANEILAQDLRVNYLNNYNDNINRLKNGSTKSLRRKIREQYDYIYNTDDSENNDSGIDDYENPLKKKSSKNTSIHLLYQDSMPQLPSIPLYSNESILQKEMMFKLHKDQFKTRNNLALIKGSMNDMKNLVNDRFEEIENSQKQMLNRVQQVILLGGNNKLRQASDDTFSKKKKTKDISRRITIDDVQNDPNLQKIVEDVVQMRLKGVNSVIQYQQREEQKRMRMEAMLFQQQRHSTGCCNNQDCECGHRMEKKKEFSIDQEIEQEKDQGKTKSGIKRKAKEGFLPKKKNKKKTASAKNKSQSIPKDDNNNNEEQEENQQQLDNEENKEPRKSAKKSKKKSTKKKIKKIKIINNDYNNNQEESQNQ